MDKPVGGAERRRRRTVRFAAAGLGLLIVVGAVIWIQSLRVADIAVDASQITIGETRTAPLGESVTFSAQVVPVGLVRLDAAEAALISERFVEPGDEVVAGQSLVRLANPEREAAVSSRIAQILSDLNNLRGQELQIEQARQAEGTTLLEAEYNLQRANRALLGRETLAQAGFANDAYVRPYRDEVALYTQIVPELRRARTESDRLRALQRQAIGSQELALRRNLEAARGQLADFTVRAPVAGRVLSVDAEVGALVAQGRTLARLDPGRGVGLEADIDEFYARRIRPGMTAEIEIQGERLRLRIDRANPEIRDGVFRIEMSFVDEPPDSLRSGQSLRGLVRLGEAREVLTVPNGPFMEASSGSFAFVLSGDGRTARRMPIQTGVRTVEAVEIVEGLSPGDRIIVSEYSSLAGADRVRIRGQVKP